MVASVNQRLSVGRGRVGAVAQIAPGIVIGPWMAGTSTTLTLGAGRARATENGGNARISRRVSGLTPGATYRVQSNGYPGPGVDTSFFRVASDANLTLGDYAQSTGIATVDETFQAPVGGVVYIGVVGVTDAAGEYIETDYTFLLFRQ